MPRGAIGVHRAQKSHTRHTDMHTDECTDGRTDVQCNLYPALRATPALACVGLWKSWALLFKYSCSTLKIHLCEASQSPFSDKLIICNNSNCTDLTRTEKWMYFWKCNDVVGRLVCHHFLTGQEVALPCSYRSIYFIYTIVFFFLFSLAFEIRVFQFSLLTSCFSSSKYHPFLF